MRASPLPFRGRPRTRAIFHHLGQRLEILAARRGAAPGQPELRAGSGSAKRSSFTRSSRPSIDGDLRQQRHAVAVRHHLHHGGEAESRRIPPARRAAAWRRTRAPGRAGNGPLRAGSAGADRCRRALIRPCARRPSAAGTASRNASSNSGSVSMSAPSAGSASITASSAPPTSSSTSKRVWVSRTSSRRSGCRCCSTGKTCGSTYGASDGMMPSLQLAAQHAAVAREIHQVARRGQDPLGAAAPLRARSRSASRRWAAARPGRRRARVPDP